MCQWGKLKYITINGRIRGIDECIFDLIEVLNKNGIETVACCCGHGKRPGIISLKDGRELIIAPNFKVARLVDKAFPPIFEN